MWPNPPPPHRWARKTVLPVVEQERGEHDVERRGGVEEAAEGAHGQGVEEDGGDAQHLDAIQGWGIGGAVGVEAVSRLLLSLLFLSYILFFF